MLYKKLLGFAAVAIVSTAGAVSADVTNVECEGFTITLSEEDTITIKEATGAEFEKTVCDVASTMHSERKYENPTKVKLTLSTGTEWDVMIQTKD